jgi:hypothetical protein
VVVRVRNVLLTAFFDGKSRMVVGPAMPENQIRPTAGVRPSTPGDALPLDLERGLRESDDICLAVQGPCKPDTYRYWGGRQPSVAVASTVPLGDTTSAVRTSAGFTCSGAVHAP